MSLKVIIEKVSRGELSTGAALEQVTAELNRTISRVDNERAGRQRAAERISRGEPLRRLIDQEVELGAFIEATKQKIKTVSGLIETMPHGEQRLKHRRRITTLEQEISTANAKLRAVRTAINQRKKTELAEEFVHQASIVLSRDQLASVWSRTHAVLQEGA